MCFQPSLTGIPSDFWWLDLSVATQRSELSWFFGPVCFRPSHTGWCWSGALVLVWVWSWSGSGLGTGLGLVWVGLGQHRLVGPGLG